MMISLFLFQIFFLDKKYFAQIAHVGKNGWVCYYSKEGLTVDYARAKAILNESIDMVKSKVLTLDETANQRELINEFELYWNNLKDIKPVLSFIKNVDKIKEIQLLKRKKKTSIICDNEGQVDSFHNSKVKRDFTVLNALYVPLDFAEIQIPASGCCWKAQQIKDLVKKNLTVKKYLVLQKKLRKKKLKNYEYVVLSIPKKGKRKYSYWSKIYSY